jgi:hypothetical protein
MTIKHIVVWKVRATDEIEKAEALATIEGALTGLIGRVPSIGTLTVGLNVAYPDKNSDIAVVADFADLDALEAYQNHPDHLEVSALIRTLVTERSAIDYQY